MSEKTKRELELEIELRETRRQLFIANASIMELRSVINDHEINVISRELKLLTGDTSDAIDEGGDLPAAMASTLARAEKTRDEYETPTGINRDEQNI